MKKAELTSMLWTENLIGTVDFSPTELTFAGSDTSFVFRFEIGAGGQLQSFGISWLLDVGSGCSRRTRPFLDLTRLPLSVG